MTTYPRALSTAITMLTCWTAMTTMPIKSSLRIISKEEKSTDSNSGSNDVLRVDLGN